ncbi:uncharacterized protein LOC119629338 [Bombyx mori]|uniref:uncharacterized protein LOC119629338 n=1 Tax=Bombyx mori TaxID=7091 RepID=UPI002ED00A4F
MTEETSKLLPVSPRKKSKDEYLSELKRQRGHLKGRLTQFKKYVDSFQDATLSKLQVAEMKLRLQTASEYFTKLNNIASEIEINCPEVDIVSHLEYFESIESLYFSTTASASCLIESFETSDSLNNEKCSHILNENTKTLNVKLPEIKLPIFDGSYDRWLEFKNSYETMIHKRSDLDAIHKFHYLRSSLSGTALQVISALEFTASNYTHAWELLENRFHNHRLLVHNHIKSLFNIPCIKQESPLQLRKLIDTILRNLRALKSLDEPTESWDTLIIYLVVTKLDSVTDREWENHKGSLMSQPNRLKLQDLLTFLRNRADMLEMINVTHSKPQFRSNQSNINETKHNQVYSYVSTSNNTKYFSNKNKNLDKTKRNCVLCNNNHKLFTCIKFLNLSITDRIKLVNDYKLCVNCLRPGHSIQDCIFGPCQQCKRKHNSLLHLDEHSESSSNTNVCTTACAPTFSAMHSAAYRADAINNNTDGRSSYFNQVLLSTALVELADQNNRYHVARALLDNGSQHSLISEKLAKRLNTNFTQSTVRIAGVGQHLTHTNKSCVISMRSKTSNFNKRISCLVLPQITSSLPMTNISLEHLNIPDNIQLADPTFDVSSDIDLLLGADIFWDLLEQGRIRLPSGPFLLNTKLGWVVSGPICSNHSNINEVQCNFSHSLDLQLRKFWEIEDLSVSKNILTQDENKCEKLFIDTTKREKEGRFSRGLLFSS